MSSTKAAVSAIEEVTLGEICDTLEQAAITETLDLGSVIVHMASCPSRGKILAISASSGRQAIVSL